MAELKCAFCGSISGEFFAEYERIETQTIMVEIQEDGELWYDYTGGLTSGESGEDLGYGCSVCLKVVETLEELLGLPPAVEDPAGEMKPTAKATYKALVRGLTAAGFGDIEVNESGNLAGFWTLSATTPEGREADVEFGPSWDTGPDAEEDD